MSWRVGLLKKCNLNLLLLLFRQRWKGWWKRWKRLTRRTWFTWSKRLRVSIFNCFFFSISIWCTIIYICVFVVWVSVSFFPLHYKNKVWTAKLVCGVYTGLYIRQMLLFHSSFTLIIMIFTHTDIFSFFYFHSLSLSRPYSQNILAVYPASPELKVRFN